MFKHRVSVLMILIAGLIAGCASDFGTVDNAAFAKWKTAIVAITIPGKGAGTGVFISSNYVLTAKHMAVRDILKVTYLDGKTEDGKLVWKADNVDIALYEVKAGITGWFPKVRCELPEIYEQVFMIGHPYAARYLLNFGHVGNKTLEKNFLGVVIAVDLNFNPGNSGGPIFDTRGDIVGIASAIYGSRAHGPGVSYMAPGVEICKALEEKGLKL